MAEAAAVVAYLRWNNYISVANFTLICYDYLLLFEKEVQYVFQRPLSVMSALYVIVRYLGFSLAMIDTWWGGLLYMRESPCHDLIVFVYWGYSVYFCCTEVILIWRLHAMCGLSKRVLYILLGSFLPVVGVLIGKDVYLYCVSDSFSVKEIVTPVGNYCTFSFNIGPMFAIYAAIPVICYDTFLVIAVIILYMKHLKEWRGMDMRPNSYVLIIVRYHLIYFVLNLANEISMAILWAKIPTSVLQLSVLFSDTAPFILAPRLIINIWDFHANDEGVNISTTFADRISSWTSEPVHSPAQEVELMEYP